MSRPLRLKRTSLLVFCGQNKAGLGRRVRRGDLRSLLKADAAGYLPADVLRVRALTASADGVSSQSYDPSAPGTESLFRWPQFKLGRLKCVEKRFWGL